MGFSAKNFFKNIFVLEEYEKVWRILFYILLAVFSFFFYQVLSFQEVAKKNGFYQATFQDCFYSLIIAFAIHLIRTFISYCISDAIERNLVDKYVGTYRKYQVQKMCKFIIDAPYYALSTFGFIYVFYGTKVHPTYFFGNGNIFDGYNDYPMIPQIQYFKEFYIFQLGHHLYSMLSFVIKRWKDPKFYEYMLHHFIASGLIFYSFLFNFWVVGSFVMVAHDVGDIFLPLLRFVGDLKCISMPIKAACLFLANFGWFYGRIYIFPQIVYIVYLAIGTFPLVWDIVKYNHYYLFTMCVVLLILDTYWFVYLLALTMRLLFGKALSNEYDGKHGEHANFKKNNQKVKSQSNQVYS